MVPTKKTIDMTLENVEAGVSQLSLSLNDEKETINIVFIGHVDAGKSTLGGNILVLTGNVDARTLEKYQQESKELNRESWYLSWALDTSQEERNKGITVECGRAVFETGKKRYTILDAPGHKNFVPNMISGAAQADIAILVISARKGEFETGFDKGGQTREHALLAKTLGVKRLLVVINKMDDMTVQWQESRFVEISQKLLPYLKSLGFAVGKDLDFIPISAFSGANVLHRVDPSVCPWYTNPGTSMIEYLDSLPLMERKLGAPFMMPVADKSKDMGTIVFGKIESGSVKKGDHLLMMPNKQDVEVAAVFFDESEVARGGKSGDIVKLKLKGIEEDDISSGFVLCSPERPVNVVTTFQATLQIIEAKNIISPGYTAVLHIHTLVEEITIVKFLYQLDPKTKEKVKKRPTFVKQGHAVSAVIQCAGPICLETYKDHSQLGRFSLRDEGKTVALGVVTKLLGIGSEGVNDSASSNTSLTVN